MLTSRSFPTDRGGLVLSADDADGSVTVEFRPSVENVTVTIRIVNKSLVSYAADVIGAADPDDCGRRADWLADNIESWYGRHVPDTLLAALRKVR